MKLKKVRMIGFKSFADETIIETSDGITAIVGPNGCGKSNILDAVRWVLGEKSGKALRGKSMDDVIFLGSEFRKPAGMAEVEMFFDNTDRSLPVDQDEVVVGRRIYLNSGSEYLLNGKRTTRREFERVFMDTGIGKSAYSIMEQGRMGSILRSSAEERRQLFDEAAGVSRFKAERQETLARLGDTEQNLLRLGDILKSKEGELKNLERQARKTREYLKLKEYLDKSDRKLRFVKFKGLEERRVKVDEKLARLLERRDQIFKHISECEEKVESFETENAGRVEEMHKLDRDYHQALAGMGALKENLERMAGELAESREKLENLEKRKRDEETQYKEVHARLEQSKQLELNLNTEIKTLEETRDKILLSLEEDRLAIDLTVKQEEQNLKELEELERRQGELVEELKNVARELIEELESRKRELQGSEEQRVALKDLIIGELDSTRTDLLNLAGLLERGDLNAAARLMGEIKVDQALDGFIRYEAMDNEFRSFLFGRAGLLAKKEELDQKMDDVITRREALQKDNQSLLTRRKLLVESREKKNRQKAELDLQIRDSEVRRESSLEARENTQNLLQEAENRLKYYSEEIAAHQARQQELAAESEKLKEELTGIQKKNEAKIKAIEDIKNKVNKSRDDIAAFKEQSRKDRQTIENILPEISEQERRAENVTLALSGMEEDLYNDYQMSVGELASQCEKMDINKDREETEFRRLKTEIQALGQFNPLAIEELERSKEAYEQIVEQNKDIESARENILDILGEINEKSEVLFKDTFERIQNNFVEIFQKLFGGGKAALTLTNPEDSLNSGVEIMVQPPGKKNSMISLLSGGEQSMTAIALMFATYLVRPAPFCFLDEIDAPLDDNNVNRFVRMLAGFASRSQFMVVTHNKLTMAQAVGIFGVTQEEPGVSKMVSVQLKDAEHLVS